MPRASFTHSRFALVALILAATAGLAAADPNDWVNVDYAIKQADAPNTVSARQTILAKAGTSAKSGPWSVVNNNGIVPPSRDVHDYLSWAPYHWPKCDWCSQGTSHLSGPNQGNSTDDDDGDTGDSNPTDNGSDPYENGGFDGASVDVNKLFAVANVPMIPRGTVSGGQHGHSGAHHRMIRRKGRIVPEKAIVQRDDVPNNAQSPIDIPTDTPVPTDTDDLPPAPTNDVGDLPTTVPGSQSTTEKGVYGTQAPAQAPARTSSGKASCTPSPTRPLAPSATWTTCPYVVHDGRVNPDVRTLSNSPAVVAMSQSVLYNAVGSAVDKTKVYAQNAARFIDAWFISPDTAMNPNVNFGQQVRGPGKAHQMGTFTGILDMRGIVKVINAVMIMKNAKSTYWTAAQDKTLTTWMKSYITWLENSVLGREVAAKANNHVSFFVNQLAAAKMYVGDTKGAQTVLKNYFGDQFQDQIAASGEQPFEAVRTRPYHYRTFNLEAMITNAKLGDQLGMNFWSTKSKYGATIQTALDFAMSQDPKDEDVSDIFPHVAAVAAAYGDPKGKYAVFLKKNYPSYTSAPFWFYDQSSALPNSPAGRAAAKQHRRESPYVVENSIGDVGTVLATDLESGEKMASVTIQAAEDATCGELDFVCPSVFAHAKEVELEDDLFTTCDELRSLYCLDL